MKTRINLFGTSFILHSDESSAYIQQLCEIIEARMQSIQSEIDCSDPLKLSIMVSLLLSHELLDEKKFNVELSNDTAYSASKLISRLDEAIES